MQGRSILVIINPVSGSSPGRERVRDLRNALLAEGCSVRLYQTTDTGDGKRRAAEARGNVDCLVVAGGDGTVREVIEGLAGHPTPLAILPSGTENLLAREMRVPTSTEAMCRAIQRSHTRAVDLARVNNNAFLLVTGIGFDGEVIDRLVATRRGHITHLSYFWPLWRTFWQHRWPRLSVVADGEEIFRGKGMVFVGNTARYALNLRVCRDAVNDDGMLDVCAFYCDHQIPLLRHSANTMMRRHVGSRGVVYQKARDIEVASLDEEPVSLEVDGDPAGILPARFDIEPRRAAVIVGA